MISNQLDDTRVELLRGSAVLDQGSDTLANTSVTILYNLDQAHIKQPGRYRFDSEPPQVKVESGDVEVVAPTENRWKPAQATWFLSRASSRLASAERFQGRRCGIAGRRVGQLELGARHRGRGK